MARSSALSRIIKEYSDGYIDSLTDFLLWATYFGLEVITPNVLLISAEMPDYLLLKRFTDSVNYHRLWQVLYRQVRLGLMAFDGDSKRARIALTPQGGEVLTARAPKAHAPLKWSGYCYLVTYDIGEKDRSVRQILRTYLRAHNGVAVQESGYLFLEDPSIALLPFVRKYLLVGRVMVSRVGEKGVIGNIGLNLFIQEKFGVSQLNSRYQDYLKRFRVSDQGNTLRRTRAGLVYFSLVKNTSALPSEILPSNWEGEAAKELYLKICRPYNAK